MTTDDVSTYPPDKDGQLARLVDLHGDAAVDGAGRQVLVNLRVAWGRTPYEQLPFGSKEYVRDAEENPGCGATERYAETDDRDTSRGSTTMATASAIWLLRHPATH